MKLLIASDIHGSAKWCRQLLSTMEQEQPDRIILLGDLLYHGPRNDLPEEYDPKAVVTMLSGLREKILAVRGNCDTEVDQMVLPFPILADYAYLTLGNTAILATHGHHINPDNFQPSFSGEILLNGHTHVTAYQQYDGFLYLNPGSVSIPKEGTPRGYILLTDGEIQFKDLHGQLLQSHPL